MLSGKSHGSTVRTQKVVSATGMKRLPKFTKRSPKNSTTVHASTLPDGAGRPTISPLAYHDANELGIAEIPDMTSQAATTMRRQHPNRPRTNRDVSIILPRGKTDTLPNKNNKATTITVDASSKIFLNNAPTTLEALEETLKAKVAEDPDVPVLVRGDERLQYGAVMDVVKVVYKCKVHRMALVTVDK